MAELEGRDHWRVGKTCAVRVHVEPRYAEYSPAFDGEVPEGFSAAAPCKVDEENQSGKVNKALDYNAATGDMKNGMFDARAKEWAKYKSFDATVVIAGEEKDKLLAQGHRPIPSKWVDTMKNMHESHKPDFDPIYKARLVSCGNLRRWRKVKFAVIRLPANLRVTWCWPQARLP